MLKNAKNFLGFPPLYIAPLPLIYLRGQLLFTVFYLFDRVRQPVLSHLKFVQSPRDVVQFRVFGFGVVEGPKIALGDQIYARRRRLARPHERPNARSVTAYERSGEGVGE